MWQYQKELTEKVFVMSGDTQMCCRAEERRKERDIRFKRYKMQFRGGWVWAQRTGRE